MDFSIRDLGVREYLSCLDFQKNLVEKKMSDPRAEDVLILVEHPPVVTLGKRGGRSFLRVSEEDLKKRGIKLVETERGGLITYHGPGQLVAYPVFDLSGRKLGVEAWVRLLETVMKACAESFGVAGETRASARGVWVGNRKLGSLGVCLRHGISFHGLALNVSIDLAPFSWMDPCGLETSMTSLERECGRIFSMEEAKQALVCAFAAFCPRRSPSSGNEVAS